MAAKSEGRYSSVSIGYDKLLMLMLLRCADSLFSPAESPGIHTGKVDAGDELAVAVAALLYLDFRWLTD